MIIENYSFGRMVIGGKSYTADLIIIGDEIFPNWWRREGHSLCLEDLGPVLAARPEVLVIGTGAYGAMDVPYETERFLEERGIEVIWKPTAEAVEIFNRLTGRKKAAAAFHLTC
ncbi:MAG: MTH938/NDUFAF3 family protein [Candidatus Saccharicenans sp.]|nr:MTH938/NDUFAF3 family protein [Candidatus Saccharicenans sp.]MDI6848879.1 MTH938/NDUFAF3 family protein [Candidatus Saccharicenans sp.]